MASPCPSRSAAVRTAGRAFDGLRSDDGGCGRRGIDVTLQAWRGALSANVAPAPGLAGCRPG